MSARRSACIHGQREDRAEGEGGAVSVSSYNSYEEGLTMVPVGAVKSS